MKRAVVLLMAIVMIFNTMIIFASAENISFNNGQITTNSDDIGTISSIFYSEKEKKININGTVAHNTMVSRNEDKLEVYRVPIGKTLEEVISAPDTKPLITADISVKFHFTIKAEKNIDRFSAYAVIIRSKTGEWITIGKPLYASVASTLSGDNQNKANYKGISTALTSNATDIGATSVIISVHFDKLLSRSSTGYLYSLQGTHIYFDKQYINELDAKIKSYNAMGSKVYLQFIFDNQGASGVVALSTANGESAVPDMRIEQNLTLICAFTDFICDKYTYLSGVILGEKIDASYPGSDIISLSKYAENFAQYMLVVANVARPVIPDLDIVLPLSDADSYSKRADVSNEPECTGAKLLKSIASFLDESHIERFIYSTMIETSSVPYGITEESLVSKSFSTVGYDGINADSAQAYSDYIKTLQQTYSSAPLGFIFKWEPDAQTTGNVLACAYAYSYFKLMGVSNISSFVVSFENYELLGNYRALDEISNLMKYIDTSLCFEITAPQLQMLGGGNWYAVIKNMYSGTFAMRDIITAERISALPEGILGSYVYYDFMYYTDVSLWETGNFCDSIKIEHSKVSGRSLRAHFTPNLRTPSEYSEFFCNYDYPESYVYTPYVSFRFSIDEDEIAPATTSNSTGTAATKKSLYEVKITMWADNKVSEVSALCMPEEKCDVLFDMSEFSDGATVDCIKISVRSLGSSEERRGYCFSLSSIMGHSASYTAGELSSLIIEERMKIRDLLVESVTSEKIELNTWMIMIGAIVIIMAIGVGVFMCFRKEDSTETEDIDTED